jgi:hypothetical protein
VRGRDKGGVLDTFDTGGIFLHILSGILYTGGIRDMGGIRDTEWDMGEIRDTGGKRDVG